MFEAYSDDELREVPPGQILEYLSRSNWTELETVGDRAQYFRAPSGYDVLVPLRQNLRDYARAVRELLDFAAEEAGEDSKAVLHDVRFVRHDITRFRAVNGEEEATISLDALPNLIGGVRDTVKAAAMLASISDTEKQKYLDSARFGPSERGSYVVTVLSPPFQLDAQFTMFEDPPPARKVTNSIRQAIGATRSAVTRYQQGDDSAFDNGHNRGITSQTCRGLYDALEPFDSVDVRISSARLLMTPSPAPFEVTFDRSDASALMVGSELLRQDELSETPDARLVGYIDSLDHGGRDGNGQAAMETSMVVPETKQTVHMMLDPKQYDLANDLHLKRVHVEARGTLKQASTNTWWLHDATIHEVAD